MYQKVRNSAYAAALAAAFIIGSLDISAQVRFPRPSPKASVMQTIGVTDVTITYSRPAVKGRAIWGDAPADAYAKGESTLDDSNKRPAGMPIVPNGHIWRTGANEATQFVVTDDVLINGQKLAAGAYSLHTIPGKEEWTIVFNGTANQWGSFNYDPKNDTLRVKSKPQWLTDPQEWLGFSIEPVKENAAAVHIRWEKVRVPFTVEVPDVISVALARAREGVAAAKADDWRTPFQAAMYAKQNKADADAAAWFDRSLKVLEASIAAKETFQNLMGKTNVLWGAGRKAEAIAAGDKAVVVGKASGVDTEVFEKRLADMKAGKI